MEQLPNKGLNPWKTKSGKTIYDNPWIRLTEFEVEKPKGGDGIYGVVHFKNYALGIIPLDQEHNTWLVGQWRYSLNEYSWEIPMGGGSLSIDRLDSAKRELLEETGLTAEDWQEIGKVHTSNSVTDEVGYIYLARELTPGPSSPEEVEVLKIKKLPLKTAIEMVMNGEITDSISMAGLLMAGRLLRF